MNVDSKENFMAVYRHSDIYLDMQQYSSVVLDQKYYFGKTKRLEM